MNKSLLSIIGLISSLSPLSPAFAGRSGHPVTVKVPPRIVLTESWKVRGHCPSHRFAKKQYAYSCFAIREDGKIVARTTFSNGKQIDGDHFVAQYMFRDARGKAVARANLSAGVNAGGMDFRRGAKEKTVSKSVKVSPARAASIRTVTIAWGRFDKRDDAKIVQSAITTLCAFLNCTEGDQKAPEAK